MTETQAPPTPPISRQSLRVMIVEDESLVGMMLQHQLEQLGHRVVGQAADRNEAVVLFRHSRPDLVLMDIRIAGDVDGLDVAKALLEERNCAMIVISAFSDQELIDRAAAAGVFGYLIKPVNERMLEAQIEVAMKRFRDLESLSGEVGKLQKDLETRKLLDRAKAILIKRAGLTEDEAHRRMLQESQKRRIPLGQLCQTIIESETLMK
jgi:two-component system, response regulator PdtaR